VLGVVWFVQRRLTRGATGDRAKTRPRDVVRVVAKRGIGAKSQVVVVEVDGTRYLLGVGEGSVSVLDSRPAQDEGAQRRALAPLTTLPVAARTTLPATPARVLPTEAPAPLRRARREAERPARPTFAAALSREASQALRRALGA